jgi:hypothetical protein
MPHEATMNRLTPMSSHSRVRECGFKAVLATAMNEKNQEERIGIDHRTSAGGIRH